MAILEKNPNPTKDQHFMVDKNMLEKIYDTADIKPGESIVEIGGGEGALTDYLIQGDNYVTVIEKDPFYAKYLMEKYKDVPNITVIEGDALNFDFSEYDRLVANLPYTITEPFLMNLASSGALDYTPNNNKGSNLKSVTLVLSQNSTRKMVAPIQITEGKSRHFNAEFGIMGAICKAFCNVDIVTAIPSEAFFPEPAVTSFLVNLTPKKEKTTVDRILRELLIDRNANHASIIRIYQMLLNQEKIYKISKHKDKKLSLVSSSFISKTIEDKNIYDLSNAQISQLVQDLIRNDVSIKSKNSNRTNHIDTSDYTRYFNGSKFDFARYDYDKELEDDLDDEEEERIFTGARAKYEKKYEYMYEDRYYNVLLHRGLEYMDPTKLQNLLKGLETVEEDNFVLVK